MITAAPIFFKNENGDEVMLAREETPLTEFIINKLRSHRLDAISIYSGNPPEKNQIEIEKPSILAIPLAPPLESVISDDLHKEAMSGIKGLFDLAAGNGFVTAHQIVKDLNNVVDQLVESVSLEKGGMIHIADLKSHDEYTYHHSLSVAVLSIAISQEMGINSDDLKLLGRCAVMHDIGKVSIPTEIINKPSKLTDEEFEIMKGHALNGARLLKQQAIGDVFMWKVVSSHHEKINGTGYPDRLSGSDIPLFSRIISVADVYDALTSFRSYRKPMSPAVAFEIIMSDVGRAFDYEVVNAFAKKIELYPVNTVMELSNKRTGVVVDTRYSLRPIIRMLDDGSLVDLAAMDNLTLMIERVVE